MQQLPILLFKTPFRKKRWFCKKVAPSPWRNPVLGLPVLSPAFRIQDFFQDFLRPGEPLQLGQQNWFLCACSPEKLRLIRLRHRISQKHLWPFLPGSEDKVITEMQICPRGQSHFRAEHRHSLAPRAFSFSTWKLEEMKSCKLSDVGWNGSFFHFLNTVCWNRKL